MAGDSRPRAAGFTLPLTLALAFSLMTLATAIVGMVVVSDEQAKSSAADLVAATTLESAIEQGLFGVERDGEPEAGEWTDQVTLNGRDVSLVFASARYKPDINKDLPAAVGAALSDEGLRQRVVAAFAPAKPGEQPQGFNRFAELVKAAQADPAEEDCLRRRLTIGRNGGQPDPLPPASALIPKRDPLTAGELIDLRAEIQDPRGGRDVLWRRVRFTGKPERVWLTHDWRSLRLGRADIDCAPPAATPMLGGFRPSL
jgi:hypothetical protein